MNLLFIRLQVFDSNGGSIDNCLISIKDIDNNTFTPVAITRSNTHKHYRVPLYLVRNKTIQISSPGFQADEIFIPGTSHHQQVYLIRLGKTDQLFYLSNKQKYFFTPVENTFAIYFNPVLVSEGGEEITALLQQYGLAESVEYPVAKWKIKKVHFTEVLSENEIASRISAISSSSFVLHIGAMVDADRVDTKIVSRMILVKLKPSYSEQVFLEFIASLGLTISKKESDIENTFILLSNTFEITYRILLCCQQLMNQPYVLTAEPQIIAPPPGRAFPSPPLPRIEPNDILFYRQWHQELIRTPETWEYLEVNKGNDMRFGNPDVITGVLDTGIITASTMSGLYYDHPEFRGNVDGGTTLSATNVKKVYFIYNFLTDANSVLMVPNNNATGSGSFHGTACASLVAGPNNRSDNSLPEYIDEGGVGIAPNTRLMSLVQLGSLSQTNQHFNDMMLFISGFNPNWSADGINYSTSQTFPAIFGTTVDHPAPASILTRSITLPPGGNSIVSGNLNLMMKFGRSRRGLLFFNAAGNSGTDYRQDVSAGPENGIMIVTGSTIDRKKAECRATYSNFDKNGVVIGGVDFCCPTDLAIHIGRNQRPYTWGLVCATSSGEITGNNKDVGAEAGNVYNTTLAMNAVSGQSNITILSANTSDFPPMGNIFIRSSSDSFNCEYANILSNSGGNIILDRPLENSYNSGDFVFRHLFPRYTEDFGGTSGATPIAAGISALVLTANPLLNNLEVRDILRKTAVPIALRHLGHNRLERWINNPSPGIRTDLVDSDGLLVLDTPVRNAVSFSNVAAGSRFINVGDTTGFKERQAILIGAETKLLTNGSDHIIVQTNDGFEIGDTIHFGNLSETYITDYAPFTYTEYYNTSGSTASATAGNNFIHVFNTQGFNAGDSLKITSPDGSIIVNVTIDPLNPFPGAFFNEPTINSLPYDGGEGFTIKLSAPLTATLPIGSTVEAIEKYTFTITNIDQAQNKIFLNTTTLPVVSPDSFVVKNNTETRVVRKIIDDEILEIDPLEFLQNGNMKVHGGLVATYSFIFGYGRLDAYSAVEAANNYTHDERDLMIRQHLNDDGVNPVNTVANPVHSPDIWIRSNPDLNGTVLDYDIAGPHQNPSLSASQPQFTGTGLHDLKLSTTNSYTGLQDAVFEIIIETEGFPDTIRWRKNENQFSIAVPIDSGAGNTLSDGISILFASNNGHNAGDRWFIYARKTDRTIYVRVKNRGNLNSTFDTINLPGNIPPHSVRCLLMLSDGSTPIDLSNYPAQPVPNYNLSSDTPGTFILSETPLNNGSALAPSKDTLHAFSWPDSALPKSNTYDTVIPSTPLRLFALAEVLPHDGILAGSTPGNNNNISFREILFSQFQFLKPDNTALPNQFTVINSTPVSVDFKLNVYAEAGAFDTGSCSIRLTKKATNNLPDEVVEFGYDGSSFIFTPAQPAWISAITSPVIRISGAPANGLQNDITFNGTIILDGTINRITAEPLIKNTESTVIASFRRDFIVFDPNNDPAQQAGNETGSADSRVYFFTNYDKLDNQSEALAFGPMPDGSGGYSTQFFNTTSKHTATQNVLAYAVVNGDIVAQEDATNSSLINIILRPRNQGAISGLRVKYFIYRGISKASLISGSSLVDPATSAPAPHPEILSAIWQTKTALHAADNSISATPSVSDLRLNITSSSSPAVLDSDNIDNLFASYISPDHQPIPVTIGMSIGYFNNSSIGFDIVLYDRIDFATAGEVRAGENQLTVLSTNPSEEKRKRRRCLLFLDPAAFYGMMLYQKKQVYAKASNDTEIKIEKYKSTNSLSSSNDDLYKIINKGAINAAITIPSTATPSLFYNDGAVYLDIRNNLGLPLNYNNNYGDSIYLALANNDPNGDPVMLSSSSYPNAETDWPIKIIRDTDFIIPNLDNNKKRNIIRLALPEGDNDNPYLYFESGSEYKRHPKPQKNKKRFIKLESDSTNIGFLKEIGIGVPNIEYMPNTQSGAWFIKVRYIRRLHADTASVTGLNYPLLYHFDNVFDVNQNEQFFSNTQAIKFTSGLKEAFLDGENSIGFSGMVTTGAAVEGGRVIMFAVPKDVLHETHGSRSIFRNILSGSSNKDNFYDVLKNVLTGLVLRKRELKTTVSTTEQYLDIADDEVIGTNKHAVFNFMGVTMSQIEYNYLLTNINDLDTQTYPVLLNIRSYTKETDFSTDPVDYIKITMGFCGIDINTNLYTELNETVTLYSTSGVFASTNAAASSHTAPTVSYIDDLSYTNRFRNYQCFKRVKYYEQTSTTNWSLYDASGNIQTYSTNEKDYFDNDISGQQIELTIGTRCILFSKKVLKTVSVLGSSDCYRVICWYRGKFRDGYISQYAFANHTSIARVNSSDLRSSEITVEAFLNDATLELHIMDEMFAEPGLQISNYPELNNLRLRVKNKLDIVLESLSNSTTSAAATIQFDMILNELALFSNFTLLSSDLSNPQAKVKDYLNLSSVSSLLENPQFLIFTLSNNSGVHKYLLENAAQYPILADETGEPGSWIDNIKDIGDGIGDIDILLNNNESKLARAITELQNLKTNIDNGFIPSDPIFVSNDYLFISDILNPANTTDPEIQTVFEIATMIFLPPTSLRENAQFDKVILSSSVPVDQSMGYIDSYHYFTMMINELNVGSGLNLNGPHPPVSFINMLTDTHHFSDVAYNLWKHMKDGNDLTDTIDNYSPTLGSISKGRAKRELFMRNPEVGMIYLEEYFKKLLGEN